MLITGLYAQTIRMYYNYHAVAKRLIREGHLVGYGWTEREGERMLVLLFDCHRPMPIRSYRIPEYAEEFSLHFVRDGDAEEGE